MSQHATSRFFLCILYIPHPDAIRCPSRLSLSHHTAHPEVSARGSLAPPLNESAHFSLFLADPRKPERPAPRGGQEIFQRRAASRRATYSAETKAHPHHPSPPRFAIRSLRSALRHDKITLSTIPTPNPRPMRPTQVGPKLVQVKSTLLVQFEQA